MEKKPLFAGEGNEQVRAKDAFAVVRTDKWGQADCPVFGIVHKDYSPLQNSKAFEFFDPIVSSGAASYETAGALGKGERIWILAKLRSTINLFPYDRVDKYLLLSNSHDGHSSVQIKVTPIRVVCQNTLTLALGHGPAIRANHDRDMQEQLKEAEHILDTIDNQYEEIEDSFRKMLHVTMRPERVKDYFSSVFPGPHDSGDKRALARAQNHREAAEFYFRRGRGNEVAGVAGSLWAAYNGVAEYVDYHQGQPGARRLKSIWFGDGYLAKARAFDIAQSKMEVWLN